MKETNEISDDKIYIKKTLLSPWDLILGLFLCEVLMSKLKKKQYKETITIVKADGTVEDVVETETPMGNAIGSAEPKKDE